MLVFLRKNFVILGSAPFYLWMLAGFGFFPLFYRLTSGTGLHFYTILLHAWHSLRFAMERNRAKAHG